MHFVCLWLYYAIHQYTASAYQVFNSIESFSWYKFLSFTVIFIHYLQDWLLLILLTNTLLGGHNSFYFCYISCLAYILLMWINKLLIFLSMPQQSYICKYSFKNFFLGLKILLLFEIFIFTLDMNLLPMFKNDLMRCKLSFYLFYWK